ncbi:hypothetical protein ACFXKI_48415 [Streptomyces mirabilis]|uniref:hypothetical protein n=1 Tax=Streptomyces mirabilis TaxID=68239 RepID=UPI00368335AA
MDPLPALGPEDDDLDLLLAADVEGGKLRVGVIGTEEGWHDVARKAFDFEPTQAAEGTDGNTDPACRGHPSPRGPGPR